MWLKLLTTKSDAAATIKEIKAAIELEVGCPLRVLRTDNGGEFTAKEFAAYYGNEGIQRHFSSPLHSTTELRCRMPKSDRARHGARIAQGESDVGMILGGEAVTTAVFLLNRAPM
jgi:hypothetical protein